MANIYILKEVEILAILPSEGGGERQTLQRFGGRRDECGGMTTHHDALASSYNIMGGWDWEETINNILMKHYNNGI